MEAFRFPNTNDKQLEQREYTVFRKSLFVKYNYHRKQRIFYAKYSNNVWQPFKTWIRADEFLFLQFLLFA